ncbi:MAG: HAD family hydrolase [Blautia sp.]|jgi:phosphoglycolate phosphatase
MYRACIFDLDGTLLDTVESLAYSGNRLLAHYGYPPLPVENYNYYAGEGASMLVRRCLMDSGDVELVHYEEAEPLYRKIFAENPYYHLKHYPGMEATVEKMKELGVKVAVFSNKPHGQAIEVIERMFGKGCFDAIQGQMEGIPRKPAPNGALKIAADFGVAPGECLYVGDTWTDMDTGAAAGMYTVGVTWGFRPEKELREHHARKIVHRPEELLDVLKGGRT